MPFSLMNGLSSLGTGVAQFAGAAGLEAQKAQLNQQTLQLADQLATVRESAGRQEAGQIAATAAEKEHGFQSGENVLTRASQLAVANVGAGATLGAANIQAAAEKYRADTQSKDVYAQIAAADPTRQQEILASQQKVAFEAVQTQNAKALQDAHTALQAETTKPDADPGKIANLKSQVVALETSASTEAATTTAAAAMYRTDMEAVQHYNTQLVTATAALNNPAMSDEDRTAQKGLVTNLQRQLNGAQRALQMSSDLMHGRVAGATGTINNAPPPSAPADATAREVGKTYMLPNGKAGVWRGTGWEAAP